MAVAVMSGDSDGIERQAKVDANGNLQVLASAGTNLNTSALAVESGGNLASIASKDFATSAKQDTQQAILDSIERLTQVIEENLSRMAFLQGVRGTAGDLRATILSGTITTVTGQTNIGGFVASQQVPATTNMNAVLSNIQNVGVA